jgi:hypothetical protein
MKCNSATATRMVRAETARGREAGGMFILMMQRGVAVPKELSLEGGK